MESITDEYKEVFSYNKINANIMRVGDTIMAAVEESGIGENCAFSKISQHATISTTEYIYQTS